MVFLEHKTALGSLAIGGYGVRLFFVLSGYLIIGGIVRNFEADGGGKAEQMRRFFVNRAFRILPIYWLTLAGAALLLAFGVTDAVSWTELAWHSAFAGNIYTGQIVGQWSAALSHLWSLAVEEQFYLLIAPLLILAGHRWWQHICSALVVTALLRGIYLVSTHAPAIQVLTDSLTSFGMIAIGGCLCQLGTKTSRLSDTSVLAVLTLYVASPIMLYPVSGLFPYIALTTIPLAAFLIVAVAGQPGSLAVKLLEVAPLKAFGRVSYGFYLYHYWITSDTLYVVSGGVLDIRSSLDDVQVPILFLVTLALSVLSWVAIEKPALVLRSRWLRAGDLRSRKPEGHHHLELIEPIGRVSVG